jgi:uncharacterized glyoxalase superfamily protein PhnB/uncharacterized protein YndB with AHSA1/START domain
VSWVDADAGAVSATVEVALPPAEAFRMFTAEIGSWYLVDRNTVRDPGRTVDIRFEPRVGGRFMDVHDAASGEGREMGRITSWEPGHRLGFTDPRGIDTEVRFEPVVGGTAVTIEQRGLDRLPPDEAEHVRRYGWRLLLGWFAAAVRQSGPGRPADDDHDHLRDQEQAMSQTTDDTVTIQNVTPYLFYEDAGAALDWLARVFGFRETARYVDADDVVRESEMEVGGTTIQLCGHTPGDGHGQGLLLIVHVDDVDAMHARVTAAGIEAAAPEQQSYGPRTFTVVDPWGYRWSFWQQVHGYEESEGGLREVRP